MLIRVKLQVGLSDIKKAGGKMELEHVDDYGNTGKVYESTNKKGIKLTDKEEFLNASGIDSGYGLYDDSIDEVYDIVHGTGPEDPEFLTKFFPDLKLKKAAGGPVGFPPVQFNPEQQPPVQGPGYETNRPKDAGKEILRRYLGSGIAGAPLPGGFSLDMPYGTNKEFDIGIGYGTDPRASDFSVGYGVNLEGDDIMGASYQGDNFDIGVKKREGSDPTFGFTWKKKFDQGGIARRPNAVPPLSGPMPQGLTFLLGDDIVKNRIT